MRDARLYCCPLPAARRSGSQSHGDAIDEWTRLQRSCRPAGAYQRKMIRQRDVVADGRAPADRTPLAVEKHFPLFHVDVRSAAFTQIVAARAARLAAQFVNDAHLVILHVPVAVVPRL